MLLATQTREQINNQKKEKQTGKHLSVQRSNSRVNMLSWDQ